MGQAKFEIKWTDEEIEANVNQLFKEMNDLSDEKVEMDGYDIYLTEYGDDDHSIVIEGIGEGRADENELIKVGYVEDGKFYFH